MENSSACLQGTGVQHPRQEALEILTEHKAGELLADGSYEKDSLNDRLVKKLCEFAKLRKEKLMSST